jgi:hypothetical protein
MDKVRKTSNSVCYTSSSEPYRIYFIFAFFFKFHSKLKLERSIKQLKYYLLDQSSVAYKILIIFFSLSQYCSGIIWALPENCFVVQAEEMILMSTRAVQTLIGRELHKPSVYRLQTIIYSQYWHSKQLNSYHEVIHLIMSQPAAVILPVQPMDSVYLSCFMAVHADIF